MKEKLFLGIGKVDVTPEIGGHLYGYNPYILSESIHDNLTVTAFSFVCGKTKALMISSCVCLINTELATSLRKELSEKLGIDSENIFISATHTHSGPNVSGSAGWGDVDMEYYNTIFKPAILDASAKAFGNPEPVLVGSATGNSYVGVNRRELTVDNRVILGQYPWGCFNPKMTVISFKTEKGDIKANIISYGCHGTAAGGNHEITRDWSGIMTDAIETLSGGITAFFNGPEGDVGPRLSNGKTTGNISYVEELGKIAAEDATRIYKTISDYKEETISAAHRRLKLPLLPRIPYDEAVEKYNASNPESCNLEQLKRDYYRKVKESYENGYLPQEYREIPQSVVRIGSIAFISFPFELFSDIGMRIERTVNDLSVISLSNTNGTEGYFVTQDQLCRGGYEVECFKYANIQSYTDDADFCLLKESLENIAGLDRGEKY